MNYIITAGIFVILTLLIIVIAQLKHGKKDYSPYEDMVISHKILFIGEYLVENLLKKKVYTWEIKSFKKVKENYIKLFGYKNAEEFTRIHFYSKQLN